MEDLVDLPQLTEEALLGELRQRFEQEKIYTWVGTTLIAINPYHNLGLYSPELIAAHVALATVSEDSLPPHVYSIAHAAFADMLRSGRSQSICNSGESGSGKTESTKIAMSFLASQSASLTSANGAQDDASGGGGQGSVEKRVMESNPVLEAFGNAKTLKNNNSSRFGKYLDVQFDQRGAMAGGALTEFLLEKARVTKVAQGERSYHVFYQVCTALKGDEREAVPLLAPSEYGYLQGSSVLTVNGVDDLKEYAELRSAVRTLGVTDGAWLDVLKVLGAILSIGNLEVEGEDQVKIKDTPASAAVADYLQCDRDALFEAMTYRKIAVGGEETSVPLTGDQVGELQRALATALYHGLFRWLVATINRLLQAEDAKTTIGILDIFGFEDFGENNSFEQFCINFANEKLHRQFLHYVFELEEADYNAEGIEYSSVEFTDNQPCIEMIEGLPGAKANQEQGIIQLLTETSKMPKGDDAMFQDKVESEHGQNDYLITTRMKVEHFCVAHYAGAVKYQVKGFLTKNRDELQADLSNVLMSSRSEQIREYIRLDANLAHESKTSDESQTTDAKGAKGGKKKKKKKKKAGAAFISTKFGAQLTELVEWLTQTNTHYVRCIASNGTKSPMVFETEHTGKQLRYAGVMDVCEVRQSGFAIRLPFDQFLQKYRNFVPGSVGDVRTETDPEERKRMCRHVLDQTVQFGMTKHEYQLGKSKCFLKQKMLQALEKLRQQLYSAASITIQAGARRMAARFSYNNLWRRNRRLQDWVRRKSARVAYLVVRVGVLALLAQARGRLGRLVTARLQADTLACQAAARGWLQRRVYARLLLDHCKASIIGLVAKATITDVAECLLFIQRRGGMDGLQDSIESLRHHTEGLVEEKKKELVALQTSGADYAQIASAAKWVSGLGEAGEALAVEAAQLERHRQEMVDEARAAMAGLLLSDDPCEITLALTEYREQAQEVQVEYDALQAHAMTMVDGVRETVNRFMSGLDPDTAVPATVEAQTYLCSMFNELMHEEVVMLEAVLRLVIQCAEDTLRRLLSSVDVGSIERAIAHYTAANFRDEDGCEVQPLLAEVRGRLASVEAAAILSAELRSPLELTELREFRTALESYKRAEPAVQEIVVSDYDRVVAHRDSLIGALLQEVSALCQSRDFVAITSRLPCLASELVEAGDKTRELAPLRALQEELAGEMADEVCYWTTHRPVDPVATLATLHKAQDFADVEQVAAAQQELGVVYQEALESGRATLVHAVSTAGSADLRWVLGLVGEYTRWVDLSAEWTALEGRQEQLLEVARRSLYDLIDEGHFATAVPYQSVEAIQKALEVDFSGLQRELGDAFDALTEHWDRLVEEQRSVMRDALRVAIEDGPKRGPFETAAELVKMLLCARPFGGRLEAEAKELERRLDVAVGACTDFCYTAAEKADLEAVTVALELSDCIAPILAAPRATCQAQLRALVDAAISDLRDCCAEDCTDFERIDSTLRQFGTGALYEEHCGSLLAELRARRLRLRNELLLEMEELCGDGTPLAIEAVVAAAVGCVDEDVAEVCAELEARRDALVSAAIEAMRIAGSLSELGVVEHALCDFAEYHHSAAVLKAYAHLQRQYTVMIASAKQQVDEVFAECQPGPMQALLVELERSVQTMGAESSLAPELVRLRARHEQALSAVKRLASQLALTGDRETVAAAAVEFAAWDDGAAKEVAALWRRDVELIGLELERLKRCLKVTMRGSLEPVRLQRAAAGSGSVKSRRE